ncbi:MAG: TetR/AcrR family transcriptional regulator [Microbacteriaceae bacterium]|nr:TetR/AcrR family transcriptional regulator [Microbacteriaceae bacterium]
MNAPGDAPRTYHSDLRRHQAEATRIRVVEAAVELFGAQGYAGTSLARIAEQAGVSVETVRNHGPKAALLRAATEYAAFGLESGGDWEGFEEAQPILAVASKEDLVAPSAANMTAVAARGAAVWRAISGAATSDPEIAETYRALCADIRSQNAKILRIFADRGWLREGMTFQEAVDFFTVVISFDTYIRVVLVEQRPVEEYQGYLERMLRYLLGLG